MWTDLRVKTPGGTESQGGVNNIEIYLAELNEVLTVNVTDKA